MSARPKKLKNEQAQTRRASTNALQAEKFENERVHKGAMQPPPRSQPKIANSTGAMHLHGRNSAMQKSPIAMQNEAKLWAPGIELGSPASHLDTLTG